MYDYITPYAAFEDWQITEILKCANQDTGYHYFINNFIRLDPEVPFVPTPAEWGLLNNMYDHQYTINVLPDASGKTTCIAIYLLWRALFTEQTCAYAIVATQITAGILIDIVKTLLRNLPQYFWIYVTGYHRQSIVFGNGSLIRAVLPNGHVFLRTDYDVLIIDAGVYSRTNKISTFVRDFLKKYTGQFHFVGNKEHCIRWCGINMTRTTCIGKFITYRNTNE